MRKRPHLWKTIRTTSALARNRPHETREAGTVAAGHGCAGVNSKVSGVAGLVFGLGGLTASPASMGT